MIIVCPYEVKALKQFHIDKDIPFIEKYIMVDWPYITEYVQDKVKQISGPKGTLNTVFLLGFSQTEEDIKAIVQPIVNLDKRYIVCDLRQVVKVDKLTKTYTIRNEAEYNSIIIRTILTAILATGNEDTLLVAKLPQKAYATWLSDNLSKRFGLNMGDSTLVYILSLMFYSQLLTDDPIAKNIENIFHSVRSEIMVPELFNEVAKRIVKLDNIDDYCQALYPVTGNTRLKDVDYTTLSNLVLNNWFGLNSKELMLTALEHPPTWISVFLTALKYRTYKNTMIYTIADKVSKKGTGDSFIKQMDQIKSQYTD